MGFLDPRFMWLNNSGGNDKLRERLDHAFYNYAWRSHFQIHSVKHTLHSFD